MIKPKAPCIDCTDRQAECHSGCVVYKVYKQNLADWNEEVKSKKTKIFPTVGKFERGGQR